jgi:hypothetical protein
MSPYLGGGGWEEGEEKRRKKWKKPADRGKIKKKNYKSTQSGI